MMSRYLKMSCAFLLIVFFLVPAHSTPPEITTSRTQAALRKVGHQVLLLAGDSTSRVLSVEEAGNCYLIKFEKAFDFDPDNLIISMNQVLKADSIAKRYLVEVTDVTSGQLVYSYEKKFNTSLSEIPCRGRRLPETTYQIAFTNLDGQPLGFGEIPFARNASSNAPPSSSSYLYFLLLIPVIILGIWFFFKEKETAALPSVKPNPELIPIGAFIFDKRNMALSHQGETIDLTSKEADLLYLLYSAANVTLERENMLKEVWGSEGDYVGRTLDVFISKLRKKLAADTNLKIINIRGIGYRFVMN
ncbi:MAG: winged helix-turn-helix domain-containing protein [Saprospiraceae bacterium]